MDKKTKKILVILCGLVVLLTGVLFSTAEGLEPPKEETIDGVTNKNVTGMVCTIPKGFEVMAVFNSKKDAMIKSFEDQYINVVQLWSKPGVSDLILFEAIGFIFDCPKHGREKWTLDVWMFAPRDQLECYGGE
jgi:hypothetical protein